MLCDFKQAGNKGKDGIEMQKAALNLESVGGSYWMTQLISGMSTPRPMTSVHTRMPLKPNHSTVYKFAI